MYIRVLSKCYLASQISRIVANLDKVSPIDNCGQVWCFQPFGIIWRNYFGRRLKSFPFKCSLGYGPSPMRLCYLRQTRLVF